MLLFSRALLLAFVNFTHGMVNYGIFFRNTKNVMSKSGGQPAKTAAVNRSKKTAGLNNLKKYNGNNSNNGNNNNNTITV